MLQILVSFKKLDVICHIFLRKGIVLEVIVLQDYIFVLLEGLY